MPVGIARLNVFVFVVSYFIIYFSLRSIFWIFQTFWIFYHKSSDLFMINPHFSLNLRNSRISSAILRFHEDFHSEIHGFHEQSSDLTQWISLNPCQIWGFIHLLYLIESVWWLEVAIYTASVGPTFLSELCNVCSIESWTLNWAHLNIDLRPQICVTS